MNLTYILLGVIVFLIICTMIICRTQSKFNAETLDTSIAPTISNESVLIFYAPWCGYCKDSMDEFKKAVSEGNGKIILIDTTEDSNKEIVEKHGVTGFPTIMKIDGTKYTGERKSEKIKKFADLT